MPAITTRSEHTGHCIKMRRSLARFSRPEASNQTLFLVDFITIMSGFRFSVHTGWFDFRVAHLGQGSPRGKAAACACRVMVISESLRDCRAYIHISLPVAGVHSPSAVRHASVPTNSSLTADDRHCCVCAANAPEAWLIGDSPAGNWRPGARGEAS
jgi:hypothetical protein